MTALAFGLIGLALIVSGIVAGDASISTLGGVLFGWALRSLKRDRLDVVMSMYERGRRGRPND